VFERLRKQIIRISPIIPIGWGLTFLCLYLYVQGPAFVQAISNFTYDAFIRNIAENQKSGAIVIVDLDDPSLNHYGQWPWSRFLVADLTRRILDAGASVVAFDVVFPEADRTSPYRIQQVIEQYFGERMSLDGLPDTIRDFDHLFANALKQGQTILGCYLQPLVKQIDDVRKIPLLDHKGFSDVVIPRHPSTTTNSLGDFLMQSDGITISIPVLSEAAQLAFFNAIPDIDSIIRSNPVIWGNGPDRVYLSLALQALRLYTGKPCIVWYGDNGVERITLGNTTIPTDEKGRVVVNYRKVLNDSASGFSSSFSTYSAMKVLNGRVGRNELEGKIVFIGASAVGLKDIKATPITQHFSGVEVHATIVDNVLAGDVLMKPGFMIGVEVLVILVIGLCLTALIARGRSWLSFLVVVGFILLSVQFSIFLLREFRFVFVPGWVILSVIVIYPVLTMIKFWQEEIQRQHVRGMFGTMVSESVLHYLENHPGSFSLSGKKAEATMFFSDVAGFTTISENLPPEKLSDLLNCYLSPMTEIIMRRGGYVDKYEGDLIMAEWGVPYAMADHALQACLAALEQQAKLDEIRPELTTRFGHVIQVRMGLNSGTVTAGNMGSSKRFQYTVMGDAVNQAARFEPVNKDYGTLITIGESTYNLVKEQVVTRQLDRIVVKGKTRPVGIYELVGVTGNVAPARLEVIQLYETSLRLHWDRRWDVALEALAAALKLDKDDGPSLNLMERIRYYQLNTPPTNWAGQYIRNSKD